MAGFRNIKIQHATNGDGEFKIPGTRYSADGYCEESNTVFEFHGDYWHGNPRRYKPDAVTYFNQRFGDLYEKTQKREQELRDLGYRVEVIWEMDWRTVLRTVIAKQRAFRASRL
jgi:G:T-mismatch repair DNA endonuclease (very short patch repair protein)